MQESISKSERITKNTVILYLRMLFTMLLALYTSRVVLEALGVSDYGIYNVVGGVVAIFSFMMSGMTVSTQRYLSYEIGKEDPDSLSRTFSLCLLTHILIALLALLIAETVGLWFVNNKLSIPEGREFAANIIYHLSVITLCIEIIIVPFNACVISHEKMNVFAYISMADAVLKLGIAFAVIHSGFDHLIIYGILMLLISVFNFTCYKIYCRFKFPETKFKFYFEKSKFKEIFSFSGFTMMGQLGQVVANYGTSILINMFFGVVVNAAIGIANQVDAAIKGLSTNFLTAFQPQLTISYASKDYDYLKKLLYSTSKLSFYLILIFAIPIIVNIDDILRIWLKTVPDYTNIFCIIFILESAINSLGNPLWITTFATGHIKKLQILTTALYFIDIAIVYLVFVMGMGPIEGSLVKVFICCCLLIVRMIAPRTFVPNYSIKDFIKKVIYPILLISLVSFAPLLIHLFAANSLSLRLVITIVSLLLSITSIYIIGLEADERKLLLSYVNRILKKK